LGDIYICYLYILLSQKDSGFFDEKGKFLIESAFADQKTRRKPPALDVGISR